MLVIKVPGIYFGGPDHCQFHGTASATWFWTKVVNLNPSSSLTAPIVAPSILPLRSLPSVHVSQPSMLLQLF